MVRHVDLLHFLRVLVYGFRPYVDLPVCLVAELEQEDLVPILLVVVPRSQVVSQGQKLVVLSYGTF